MAKGIRGKDIYKLKRVDDKSIIVILNSGRVLKFSAEMCDYYDCHLVAREIDNE